MPTPRDHLLQRALDALIAELGGAQVYAWMERHQAGETFAAIAQDAGVAASTVHKRVHHLRGKLAGYGLLPSRFQNLEQR